MATTTGNPYPSSDQPPHGGMSGSNDAGLSSTGTLGGSTYAGTSGSGMSADETLSRVKQGAHDAVDRIAEKAAPAVEKMRSSISGMSDTMHARAEQFGELEEQWMETCRTTVRENPLASIAIAVAAGVVLSKMLSSR